MSSIQTILVENHDHPYVTFNAVMRSGALEDPPEKEGLAFLAANMWLRGTAKRSQAQLADDVDYLGSLLDVYIGRESTFLRADAIKRNLPELCAIAADATRCSVYADDELGKLRRQTAAHLRNLRNHDEALARQFFHQLLYDAHAYGRPTRGTAETLGRITREDLIAHVEAHFRKDNLFVASSGDLTAEELAATLDEHFGDLPSEETSKQTAPPVTPVSGRSVLLIDKPERTQSQVAIGHLCIRANDPDYFPLLLANTVFGGTFTSRLTREIREKRGWSYGAYSQVFPSRFTGSFSMRFYPKSEDTAAAVTVALEMMEELVAGGVSEDELAFAKSYLINHYPFKVDTPAKRLEQLITGEILGWPDDFLERYVPNIECTTREMVAAALKKHLHPDDLVIAVLASDGELRDQLGALKGVRQVLVHRYDKDWQPPEDGVPRR